MSLTTSRLKEVDVDVFHITNEYGSTLTFDADGKEDLCVGLSHRSPSNECIGHITIKSDDIKRLIDYLKEYVEETAYNVLCCRTCKSNNVSITGTTNEPIKVYCNMCRKEYELGSDDPKKIG